MFRDQLVLTPSFMGSEPVLARSGKYVGTRVFATEEEQGFALMRSLSSDERVRATIGKDLPSELLTAAFCDNRRIEPIGIRYGELPPEGRERLEASGRIAGTGPRFRKLNCAVSPATLSLVGLAWLKRYRASRSSVYQGGFSG